MDRKAEAYMDRIGYGNIPEDEAKANARLIAAAPELLEACRALLRCVKGSPDDHTLDVAVSAGNVVAKAEGK